MEDRGGGVYIFIALFLASDIEHVDNKYCWINEWMMNP